MEDLKLKVGDEVYTIYTRRYSPKITGYEFQKVVRLTKTRAVLESGAQIVNEPIKRTDLDIFFLEYSTRIRWMLSTDEAKRISDKFYRTRKISDWFSSKEFTDEEKELIYNQFEGNK